MTKDARTKPVSFSIVRTGTSIDKHGQIVTDSDGFLIRCGCGQLLARVTISQGVVRADRSDKMVPACDISDIWVLSDADRVWPKHSRCGTCQAIHIIDRDHLKMMRGNWGSRRPGARVFGPTGCDIQGGTKACQYRVRALQCTSDGTVAIIVCKCGAHVGDVRLPGFTIKWTNARQQSVTTNPVNGVSFKEHRAHCGTCGFRLDIAVNELADALLVAQPDNGAVRGLHQAVVEAQLASLSERLLRLEDQQRNLLVRRDQTFSAFREAIRAAISEETWDKMTMKFHANQLLPDAVLDSLALPTSEELREAAREAFTEIDNHLRSLAAEIGTVGGCISMLDGVS